jgi:hypothetical protein
MATENVAAGSAEPSGVATPAAAEVVPAVAPVTPAASNVVPGGLVPDASAAVAAAIKKADEGAAAEPVAPVKPAAVAEDGSIIPEVDPAAAPARTEADYVIDLGTNSDGIDMNTIEDGGAVDRYKTFCVNSDITPEQAQKLITYQQGELADAQSIMIETGTAELKKLWGGTYAANRDAGLSALAVLDRRMGGRVGPIAKQQQWANDPFITEVLHQISTMVGEDSLGAGGPGGVDDNKPVSAEEAYDALYKEGAKKE